LLLMPAVLLLAGAAWALSARGSGWWAQALRSGYFVRCGLGLMACAVALHVVALAIAGLGRRRRVLAGQDGLAVVEFVLLFPVALAIVLVMIQTAMMMAGNMLVHYSAFAAARSAMVIAPSEVTGKTIDLEDVPGEDLRIADWTYERNQRQMEPRNSILVFDAVPDDTGRVLLDVARTDEQLGVCRYSQKARRIHLAAILSLLSICPAGQSTEALTAVLADEGPNRLAGAKILWSDAEAIAGIIGPIPDERPGWLGSQFRRRFEYACANTEVFLHMEKRQGQGETEDMLQAWVDPYGGADWHYRVYGPRSDVRVTVRHKLFLSIPVANRFLGEKLQGSPGLYATDVTASYVLVNQGQYDNVEVEYVEGTGQYNLLR